MTAALPVIPAQARIQAPAAKFRTEFGLRRNDGDSWPFAVRRPNACGLDDVRRRRGRFRWHVRRDAGRRCRRWGTIGRLVARRRDPRRQFYEPRRRTLHLARGWRHRDCAGCRWQARGRGRLGHRACGIGARDRCDRQWRHRIVRSRRLDPRIRRQARRHALDRFEQRRQARRERGSAARRACRQPGEMAAHGAHSSRYACRRRGPSARMSASRQW